MLVGVVLVLWVLHSPLISLQRVIRVGLCLKEECAFVLRRAACRSVSCYSCPWAVAAEREAGYIMLGSMCAAAAPGLLAGRSKQQQILELFSIALGPTAAEALTAAAAVAGMVHDTLLDCCQAGHSCRCAPASKRACSLTSIHQQHRTVFHVVYTCAGVHFASCGRVDVCVCPACTVQVTAPQAVVSLVQVT